MTLFLSYVYLKDANFYLTIPIRDGKSSSWTSYTIDFCQILKIQYLAGKIPILKIQNLTGQILKIQYLATYRCLTELALFFNSVFRFLLYFLVCFASGLYVFYHIRFLQVNAFSSKVDDKIKKNCQFFFLFCFQLLTLSRCLSESLVDLN